jgi:hypothetical protein
MRLIFEEDWKEDNFEIILSEKEIEQIVSRKGAYGFVLGGLWQPKNLNILLRKENIGELNSEEESSQEQSES